MLEAARKLGKPHGVTNIYFVQGKIDDLSEFEHDSFELVLCLDSPLSFCYDSYEAALRELIMNRSQVITEGTNFDLKH
ncbi:MAG TPA: class I SAM-dependent methyltransferase [Candidatus Latescibacteria bacterium]|nr:class I SAM-dependent methyltransferase [Candidatus Latescibacterota bacterium]